MTTKPDAAAPRDIESPETLTKALKKSEQATEMVKESAEDKVERATEELEVVNLALEDEIRDRTLVDHELAAITEQEKAARYASFHDILTGRPNRALFNHRLEHGLAQAKRHGWSLAVMFLDLDKFKSINDTHGHHVGDEVLKEVAQKIINALQAPLAINLREPGLRLAINASIGIAVYPKDGDTVDALVNSADKAMYKAKQNSLGHGFAE